MPLECDREATAFRLHFKLKDGRSGLNEPLCDLCAGMKVSHRARGPLCEMVCEARRARRVFRNTQDFK